MYTKSYTVYFKENKMSKYIQEMQNKYSRGHEQMEKRPYLVVYDSKELNFAYLHSIDWQARNINIENKIGQTNPKIEKIQQIQESLQRVLKNKFS